MKYAVMARSSFVAGVLSVMACNGELVMTTHGSCLANPQLLVVSGSTPVFTWPDGCGFSSLQVVMVSSPSVNTSVVWSFSVSQARVTPSIAYGSAPVGATIRQSPRALVSGQLYRVSVLHSIGRDGLMVQSEATFRQ
jgi:hypothetical protein